MKTESPYEAWTSADVGTMTTSRVPGRRTETFANMPGKSFSSPLGMLARSLIDRVTASIDGSTALMVPSASFTPSPSIVTRTGMPRAISFSLCWGSVKSTNTVVVDSSVAIAVPEFRY